MRALIIGSEGNIGSQLVPHLRKCYHVIHRCDQVQGFAPDYSVVNILNSGDLLKVFLDFKPQVTILLAAMVSRVTCEASPHLTIDTNLTGLNNVIQLCKAFDSKLVYFSTSEVYGNIGGVLSEDRECKPNNLYGLTKYLGEKLVQYELKNYLIVRPFMFYREGEKTGENHSAMIRFSYHLSRKEKITVHKGSLRSWLHISDGVRIIEALLHHKESHVVNIGSGEPIRTELLAAKICAYFNLKYEDYVDEYELPDKMTLEKIPDITRQTELSGLVPEITLDEGIKRVCDKIILYN